MALDGVSVKATDAVAANLNLLLFDESDEEEISRIQSSFVHETSVNKNIK